MIKISRVYSHTHTNNNKKASISVLLVIKFPTISTGCYNAKKNTHTQSLQVSIIVTHCRVEISLPEIVINQKEERKNTTDKTIKCLEIVSFCIVCF